MAERLAKKNRVMGENFSGSMKNALTDKIIAEYLSLRTSCSKLDHSREKR